MPNMSNRLLGSGLMKTKSKIKSFEDVKKALQDLEKAVNEISESLNKESETEVADADAKIQILLTTARIIPEHIDITGEIDKLLGKIEHAESKMAILKRKYGIN